MESNGAAERRAARLHAAVVFLRRVLGLSFLLNLVLAVLVVRGCLSGSSARAILVDGQLVCLVRSERAANQAHDSLLSLKKGTFKGDASFKQKWEDKPWPAKGEKIQTVKEAVELLTSRLDVVVEGYAIQVKGRDLVVLPSKEKAEETFNTLKAKFLVEGETALEPQRFEVEPTVVRTQVSPDDLIDDIRTAAGELLRGTEAPEEYVVRRGDAPASVAAAHHMPLAKLHELNPGLREKAAHDDIHAGDKWIVAGPRPAVVVITKKETTHMVPVPFKMLEEPRSTLPKGERRLMREGQAGEAKEWIRGTWRNDQLVPESRRVIRQEITREPINKIVAVGTATGNQGH